MKLLQKLFSTLLSVFGIEPEGTGDYFNRLNWFARWPSQRLSVRILSSDVVRMSEVKAALQEWQNATKGTKVAVSFNILAEDTPWISADIIIDLMWVSPNIKEHDGYTETKKYNGILVSAKCFLATQCETKNLRRLAAHELGHALGLGGHSDDDRDVTYSPVQKGKPTNRDVRTLIRAWREATEILKKEVDKAA